MYIRVLCTIIYQSDDLALSASDTSFIPSPFGTRSNSARPCLHSETRSLGIYVHVDYQLLNYLAVDYKLILTSTYIIKLKAIV